jgi:hypothetical protein
MHEGQRHHEARHKRVLAAGRQFQAVAQDREQILCAGGLIRIESQPQIAAGKPPGILPKEPIDEVGLPDAGHSGDDDRAAHPSGRKKRSSECFALNSASNEQILDPGIRQ